MLHDPPTAYPGEQATAAQIARLAHEYRIAAERLRPAGRRGKPLSYAPYRLNAIHAIELYLNALLVAAGRRPEELRGHGHDLAARAGLASAAGLVLRARTAAHLHGLSNAREYLRARYAAEAPLPPGDVNRLEATLAEVAGKVTALLERA